MASGSFYELLKKQYDKKVKVDVVANKRKHLKDLMEKASGYLKGKNYVQAATEYKTILNMLETDPYPDEFNLSDDATFCLKCCFCYSFIMSLTSYKNDVESNVYFLDIFDAIVKAHPKHFFLKYLMVVYNYKKECWWKAIYYIDISFSLNIDLKDEKYKSVHFFNTDLIPELDITYLIHQLKVIEQCCLYGEVNSSAKLDDIEHAKKMYETQWIKLWTEKCNSGQNPNSLYTNFHVMDLNDMPVYFNRNYQKLSTYIEPVLVVIDPSDNKNFRSVQTQTQDWKHTDRHVQTDNIKKSIQNVSTQTSFQDKEALMREVLCIKQMLKSSHENADSHLKKLSSKVNDLKNKVGHQYSKKNSEKNADTIASELKIKQLTEALEVSERRRKNENTKNISFQKFLVDQLSDKYNIYRKIYNDAEKRCKCMISLLDDMMKDATATTLPTVSEFHCFRFECKNRLVNIEKQIRELKVFYRRVKKEAMCSTEFEIVEWPEILHVPEEDMRFLLETYKQIFQRNIILERSEKSRNPEETQGLCCLADIPSGSSQENSSADIVSMCSHKATYSQPPVRKKGNRRTAECHRDIENSYLKDQEVYQYIRKHCVGVPEDQLISAIIAVFNKNNETLADIPKESILEDVEIALRVSNDSRNSIKFSNEYSSRETCPICFEDILPTNLYTLPCKHVYHKKCIKAWCRKKKVCPICRVNINEEYPPL